MLHLVPILGSLIINKESISKVKCIYSLKNNVAPRPFKKHYAKEHAKDENGRRSGRTS